MKKRPATAVPPTNEAQILTELLAALEAAVGGDVTVRLPHDGPGLMSELARAFNQLMEGRPLAASAPSVQPIDALQSAVRQVKQGDFSIRLPANLRGPVGDTYLPSRAGKSSGRPSSTTTCKRSSAAPTGS
ncbi:MAG TPA: HAMP domain-containing protein [Stenomitos sp.]